MGRNWAEHHRNLASRSTAECDSLAKGVFESSIEEVEVPSWGSLVEIVSGRFSGDRWAFRGHANSAWKLQSSLERILDKLGVLHLGSTYETEDSLIAEFRARAGHYINNLPAASDVFEWLALMQHHGVPTRLLDWTLSPYVALFFAIESAVPNESCCVWAIDWRELKGAGLRSLKGLRSDALEWGDSIADGGYEEVFVDNPKPAAVPLRPARMNERLTIQQGLFICPTSLLVPFETNVMGSLAFAREPKLYKFIISSQHRLTILRELERMNINEATLFPGLDGFARYLRSTIGMRYIGRI